MSFTERGFLVRSIRLLALPIGSGRCISMDAYGFLLNDLYEKLDSIESSKKSFRGLTSSKPLPQVLEGYSCSRVVRELLVVFRNLGFVCKNMISSLNDPSDEEHCSVWFYFHSRMRLLI
jgi:hypothetical protein